MGANVTNIDSEVGSYGDQDGDSPIWHVSLQLSVPPTEAGLSSLKFKILDRLQIQSEL